ncbi:DinB family protein [Nocardioides marinquilinus]|uniref:DinB family protein n=1 Tax=Nocardioides marinquilinus TaxID=1210400 RepID=A0ABP9Q3R8_9ACTN
MTKRTRIGTSGSSHPRPTRSCSTGPVDDEAAKALLRATLDSGRDAVLSKLEGLDDYDVRRPLTPTATNLLGLVKHLATWESRYLGHVLGRPCAEPVPPWEDRSARGTDSWVAEHETRDDVLTLFARVREHADATIAALPLDAPGEVPWWRPRETTLFDVLVHLVAETSRHAGHADILRETLDGVIGTDAARSVRVADDADSWAERWATVERTARAARGA